jgi:hypothetical protein
MTSFLSVQIHSSRLGRASFGTGLMGRQWRVDVLMFARARADGSSWRIHRRDFYSNLKLYATPFAAMAEPGFVDRCSIPPSIPSASSHPVNTISHSKGKVCIWSLHGLAIQPARVGAVGKPSVAKEVKP